MPAFLTIFFFYFKRFKYLPRGIHLFESCVIESNVAFVFLSSWVINCFCSIYQLVYFFCTYVKCLCSYPSGTLVTGLFMGSLFSSSQPFVSYYTMLWWFSPFHFIIFWHLPKQFPSFSFESSEVFLFKTLHESWGR